MGISQEISDWMNNMYSFLKGIKSANADPTTVHPPMPGTTVISTTTAKTQPSSSPSSAPNPNQVVTPNLPPSTTGAIITPDFGDPVSGGKYPTKPLDSVLTINVAPTPTSITAEVWTANADGTPNYPVQFGQSLPGANEVKVKIARLGVNIPSGQLMYLIVRTSPPDLTQAGLEANFQMI